MHDLKAIRDDRDAFVAALARRGMADAGVLADGLLAQDKALRELLSALQAQQARRNDASKLIGQAKQKKDEAGAASLMAEVAGLKDAIQQGEARQRDMEEALKAALAVIPNLPASDVPDGADEKDNVAVAARAFGKAGLAYIKRPGSILKSAKPWARWISSVPPRCRARALSI